MILPLYFLRKKHMKQYEMDSKSNVSHTIHDYCIEPRKTFPYIFCTGRLVLPEHLTSNIYLNLRE